MSRKKTSSNPKDRSSRPIEDMSLSGLTEEMRQMEKVLGKEQFNHLLYNILNKYGTVDDENPDLKPEDILDIITPSEWRDTHPAALVCGSDSYYANLANELFIIIYTCKLDVKEPARMAREMAIVLAAYFEDVVSQTKVFSAMRRVCMQKYGYRLPFYDCDHDDYMPDHINEEDIRFLIWKSACMVGIEEVKTYSPLAPGWKVITDIIFDVLNSRYEEAKEATRVTDWLRRAFRKEDYIDIREIATWLVFHNPLTYMPGYLDTILEEGESAAEETDLDPETADMLIYSYIAREAWQRSMSPMGCPSATLISALAAEFGFDTLSAEIREIEILPKQIYAVSRDKKTRQILFETSSHERFHVQRDSIAQNFKLDMFEYAECTLLKFKDKYLLNGMMRSDSSMKEKWEAQPPMPYFEKQQECALKWIEACDGKQVLCVSNLTALFKKLQMPLPESPDILEAENFIVLISKELGIAVLPDMGYAFDIPGNRFYRKGRAEKDSFGELIFNNSIPYDVATYIQAHNLLPQACIGASQGTETGRKIVQDYMAFWIGFYCELPSCGTPPAFEYYDNPELD